MWITYRQARKKVWISYLWDEELETFYQRIMKFHDLSLGKALLENQTKWIKPLLKYPILTIDCNYDCEEFHALFYGIVLRDVRRVNQRRERPAFYIACFIYPPNPQKIEEVLQEQYCAGVWIMAQKEKWIFSSGIKQRLKKAI